MNKIRVKGEIRNRLVNQTAKVRNLLLGNRLYHFLLILYIQLKRCKPLEEFKFRIKISPITWILQDWKQNFSGKAGLRHKKDRDVESACLGRILSR